MVANEILDEVKLSKVSNKPKTKASKPDVNVPSKKTRKPKGPKANKKNPAAPRFKCSHCSLAFQRAVSLGGHVSKAHPGQ